MSESASDTWFKLRLSPSLRKRLEDEAAQHGITLTAEILARLESTLSGADKRIDDLERLTSDEEFGNRALWKHFSDLYDEIERLRSEVETAKEKAGVPHYDPD